MVSNGEINKHGKLVMEIVDSGLYRSLIIRIIFSVLVYSSLFNLVGCRSVKL